MLRIGASDEQMKRERNPCPLLLPAFVLCPSPFLAQVNIYAERSSLLWKAPDALDLLRAAATLAAELSEGGSAAQAAAAAAACLRSPSSATATAASSSSSSGECIVPKCVVVL